MILKYVDLFSGIGGIRLGLSQALETQQIQSKCVLSCDIDPKARETYCMNFGETPQGDIRDIDDIEPFHVLLAGFPCQPFSYAGKHRGFGDTRGTLFFEIERLLKKYQPKIFLLENVRGLKTHDNGRTFNTIVKNLQALGYGVTDLLLNSSDFGVPQNRVRLYILGLLDQKPNINIVSHVGAKDSHSFKPLSPKLPLFNYCLEHKSKTVKDVLQEKVDDKYKCSNDFIEKLWKAFGKNLNKLHGYRLIDYRGGNSLHSWELGLKGDCTKNEINFMNLLIKNRRRQHFGSQQDGKMLTIEQIKSFYKKNDILDIVSTLQAKGYISEKEGKYNPVCGNMSFEVFKFLDPNSISITLTSTDSDRLGIVQNNTPRRITPRECARLQGFPDSYICHTSDAFAYKQFGNSVSVPVIKAIFCDFFNNNTEHVV